MKCLKKQNIILRDKETLLNSHFKAIKVVGSTIIILTEHLKTTYRGSGCNSSSAAVIVRLQLDLLTGSFINCNIFEAVSNDTDYLPVLKKSIEQKELQNKIIKSIMKYDIKSKKKVKKTSF